MKKISILIITLLCTAGLFAQPAFSPSLEYVCECLATKANTTGDFTQTKTIQTNGRKLKSSGKYIICPEGILWRTEKPIPSSLILTKDKMVQIAANGKKSVMDGKDNQIFSNISDILSSVFSGNAESIRKNFKCNFKMEESGEWSASLEPKDSTIASVMNTLVLSGTSTKKGDAEMTSLVISETSGNTITYEFTNQTYPKELSADEKQNFVVE